MTAGSRNCLAATGYDGEVTAEKAGEAGGAEWVPLAKQKKFYSDIGITVSLQFRVGAAHMPPCATGCKGRAGTEHALRGGYLKDYANVAGVFWISVVPECSVSMRNR